MAFTEPLPTGQVIAELADSEKPLLSSNLAELSNLTTTETELFENTWTTIAPERRRQIVNRLVELADDNIELNFDTIFKHCLKDREDDVRSTAIEGLWENEESSLFELLVELLEQDSSEKVQAAAAVALGKFAIMAEHEKLHPQHQDRLQQALLRTIDDNKRTIEVRRRALESISPLSIAQVKTAITKAYQSPLPELKISSIYAMGKNCDPSWLPVVLKELNNPEAEVRYEAAGACRELEDEAAVPGLIELIDDFDPDVQMAAIQALGEIGNTEAKESLSQCLESEDEVVREMAEQVVKEMQSKEDPLSFRM